MGQIGSQEQQQVVADRKEDADVVTWAATTEVDFDAGLKDNKVLTVTGDTNIDLLATRTTDYYLFIVQDATGGRVVTFSNTINPPPVISTTPDSETVLHLTYNAVSGTWSI